MIRNQQCYVTDVQSQGRQQSGGGSYILSVVCDDEGGSTPRMNLSIVSEVEISLSMSHSYICNRLKSF